MSAATLDLSEERPDDLDAIRAVNRRAFGRDDEADLVDRLRQDGDAILSLVALAGVSAKLRYAQAFALD